jgi:hypothetical protein
VLAIFVLTGERNEREQRLEQGQQNCIFLLVRGDLVALQAHTDHHPLQGSLVVWHQEHLHADKQEQVAPEQSHLGPGRRQELNVCFCQRINRRKRKSMKKGQGLRPGQKLDICF